MMLSEALPQSLHHLCACTCEGERQERVESREGYRGRHRCAMGGFLVIPTMNLLRTCHWHLQSNPSAMGSMLMMGGC